MGFVVAGMTRAKRFVVFVRNPCAQESGTYPIWLASALILALVAAETSGASCRAFETVITETPMSWAMSLSRTIGIKNSKLKIQNEPETAAVPPFLFLKFSFQK